MCGCVGVWEDGSSREGGRVEGWLVGPNFSVKLVFRLPAPSISGSTRFQLHTLHMFLACLIYTLVVFARLQALATLALLHKRELMLPSNFYI